MTLRETAESGDRLQALQALRDRLASDLDVCVSMRDVASLSQRFMDVLKQIDELGGGEKADEKETGLSDFEKRLRERESSAKGSRKAAGS